MPYELAALVLISRNLDVFLLLRLLHFLTVYVTLRPPLAVPTGIVPSLMVIPHSYLSHSCPRGPTDPRFRAHYTTLPATPQLLTAHPRHTHITDHSTSLPQPYQTGLLPMSSSRPRYKCQTRPSVEPFTALRQSRFQHVQS